MQVNGETQIHPSAEFDNLNALPVLLAVADAGSLTAAARQLDLSTAAVSAAIKRIENDIGVRMFERTTRVVRATAEGAVMIEHARRALAIVAQAREEIRDSTGELTGRIAIAASVMMGRELLVRWIAEFAARHPAVEVDLEVSDRQVDLIRDGFDVALRNGPLADSGLAARLMTPAHRVACASPAYLAAHGAPMHPRDLGRHQCLVARMRGRVYDRWRFASAASPSEQFEVVVGGRLSAHDASTAYRWALEGCGITYQSELVVAEAIEQGALVRVLPSYVGDEAPLYAVLPNNHLISRRVTVLLAELSDFFRGRRDRAAGPPSGEAGTPGSASPAASAR